MTAGVVACSGPPKPLVVSGAGIIDGTGSILETGRVVIENERVSCVGRVEDCAAPGGADVLDATGFWVLPGLINADAAIDENPGDEQVTYLSFVLGVTTKAGAEPPAGLYGSQPPPEIGSEDRRIPVPRAAEAAEGHADLFERAVAASLGPLPAPSDPREAEVDRRVRWGQADPEVLLDSARAMGARGETFVPYLIEQELYAAPYRFPMGLHMLLDHPLVTERIQDRVLPDRTEAEAASLTAGLEALRTFVSEFHAAGGNVAVGTRARLAPGLSVHEEMRALVTAGLDPIDAVYAGTSQGAEILGLDDSRGTLEVGKLGDLIIVEGDPRMDIAHTHTISRVVKGGVLYDPPTLFDALLDQPGSRVSDNRARLWIGLGVLALTLLFLWRAVLSHRRSMGPRLEL